MGGSSVDEVSSDQPHPSTPLLRVRYRIRFGKQGPLRYISHLDLARVWERVLRRAQAPLIYSQGFNPRPQLQLAAALPLGCASTCELIDVWMDDPAPPPAEMLLRLRAAAPAGLVIEEVWSVDLNSPALQTLTRSVVYQATPAEEIAPEELQARVERLLDQPEIWRDRRERRYDLRPLIHCLRVMPGDRPTLEMELSLSQERGTGRPDEVLSALGLDPLAARITRTAITFDKPLV